ncbi:MAG: rhomboid family intramembrane serine protease [Pseudomonadota bacterium]
MRMPLQRSSPGSPPSNVPVHRGLWLIVGSWVAIELLMAAADRGIVSPFFSRWVLYSGFGFEDVVFEQALSGNGVQPKLIWSLVSHAFLHGGWPHLLLNAAAFLGLAHGISRDAGFGATFVIFLVTAAAGAVTFGLSTESWAPLVGASGAVFGLLGVLTCWQERWLASQGAARDAIWARIAGVIAINLLMAIGFGDLQIAWQAHLGGFAMGWLMGYVYPPIHHARRARERFLRPPMT